MQGGAGAVTPVPVTFPLLGGEWLAAQTPGGRMPSYGTDQLGQRYACDFVQASDWELGNSFWGGMRSPRRREARNARAPALPPGLRGR